MNKELTEIIMGTVSGRYDEKHLLMWLKQHLK